MDRMLFFLWRLWRHPPQRRTLIVMMAALALSLDLVAVERLVGWPDWLRAERVPVQRLPHL